MVALSVVSALRASDRRADLPADRRAARAGVDAICRAPQPSATRNNAHRYLSRAARTPDSAPDHRDDAAHLSWRDAVVHDGQRTIFPPSDTAQRSAATHPRIAGIASGDLLQDRYSIVTFRVSFTRNVRSYAEITASSVLLLLATLLLLSLTKPNAGAHLLPEAGAT